jgi:hypothetical protein
MYGADAPQVALNNSADPRSSGEVVANLKRVSLGGASGIVELNSEGDRALYGTQFQMANFILPDGATDGHQLVVQQTLNFFPWQERRAAHLGGASTRVHASGTSGCPCLASLPAGLPVDADGMLVSIVDGNIQKINASYGMGACEQHDLSTPACTSVSTPPEWCFRHWYRRALKPALLLAIRWNGQGWERARASIPVPQVLCQHVDVHRAHGNEPLLCVRWSRALLLVLDVQHAGRHLQRHHMARWPRRHAC